MGFSFWLGLVFFLTTFSPEIQAAIDKSCLPQNLQKKVVSQTRQNGDILVFADGTRTMSCKSRADAESTRAQTINNRFRIDNNDVPEAYQHTFLKENHPKFIRAFHSQIKTFGERHSVFQCISDKSEFVLSQQQIDVLRIYQEELLTKLEAKRLPKKDKQNTLAQLSLVDKIINIPIILPTDFRRQLLPFDTTSLRDQVLQDNVAKCSKRALEKIGTAIGIALWEAYGVNSIKIRLSQKGRKKTIFSIEIVDTESNRANDPTLGGNTRSEIRFVFDALKVTFGRVKDFLDIGGLIKGVRSEPAILELSPIVGLEPDVKALFKGDYQDSEFEIGVRLETKNVDTGTTRARMELTLQHGISTDSDWVAALDLRYPCQIINRENKAFCGVQIEREHKNGDEDDLRGSLRVGFELGLFWERKVFSGAYFQSLLKRQAPRVSLPEACININEPCQCAISRKHLASAQTQYKQSPDDPILQGQLEYAEKKQAYDCGEPILDPCEQAKDQYNLVRERIRDTNSSQWSLLDIANRQVVIACDLEKEVSPDFATNHLFTN